MPDARDPEKAIDAVEVTKVYKGTFRGGFKALDALSLSVRRGEIFGLLGPNGAGKTTLVKILLDICRPTEGLTSLFGVDSRSVAARARVGYLPEDHQFPPYLTGMTALELYGSLSGMGGPDLRPRSEEMLAKVGLAEFARVKVRKYSKGMKQRLGIAQAIFHDPDLVFLDEPTDGVDPVGRRAIRDLLLELQGRGKTVFLNSHLLLEVEMICSRVAILDRGRLLRVGPVSELTRTENEYRVRTTGDPAAALAAVRGALGEGAADKDGIRFHAEGEAGLDKALDALAAGGFRIRELQPVKATLEDIFIRLVQDTRAAGEAGAGGSEPAGDRKQ
ncbi:MAG: ABC transporter ATP-binding protein [Planctomycetes bacterium]|nr:ABC transporter ATP-binding protein [Planctomycetota bacterium]